MTEPDQWLFSGIFRLGWNMSSGLLDLFAIDRKRHIGDKSSLEGAEMIKKQYPLEWKANTKKGVKKKGMEQMQCKINFKKHYMKKYI